MGERCVFCDIVAGRALATIFDDEHSSIVIVPLSPVTDGHVLVIPKRHVRDATEDVMITAGVMVHAARWASLHDSANILTSIGRPATQSVFHFHVHVVPRTVDDGLMLPWTEPEPDIARCLVDTETDTTDGRVLLPCLRPSGHKGPHNHWATEDDPPAEGPADDTSTEDTNASD